VHRFADYHAMVTGLTSLVDNNWHVRCCEVTSK